MAGVVTREEMIKMAREGRWGFFKGSRNPIAIEIWRRYGNWEEAAKWKRTKTDQAAMERDRRAAERLREKEEELKKADRNVPVTIDETLKQWFMKEGEYKYDPYMDESELARIIVEALFGGWAATSARNPIVYELAEQLSGRNDTETAINILNYLYNNLEYNRKAMKEWYFEREAKDVIQKGYGVCSDYSIAMCAMLKARDIPCRLIEVGTPSGGFHMQVEVLLDHRWIRFDPTWGLHGLDPNMATAIAKGTLPYFEVVSGRKAYKSVSLMNLIYTKLMMIKNQINWAVNQIT